MSDFESEKAIEKKLIAQLTEDESQWTLREDIHDVKDLWANFRRILVQNNKEIFDDHPLTDSEFKQVKAQLTFSSPYDAALWLQGENGIARVEITREDASLGKVRPVVFKREDIAGGSSVYEVVHQIKTKKLTKMDRDRRGDVTLLINGLPVIQIEVKNRSTAYIKAFNQIKKYEKEGVYRDIFSSLQMFVVSNGTDTRYIAAAPADKLNRKFLSAWLDNENKPITKYLPFAKAVLSIPAAHRMISQYGILDSKRKAVILLRPYQIHAIEAVSRAANPYDQADPTQTKKNPGRQSGYIWHTTGSGKTITAYKVAHNLTYIPGIEKVIFVVDRRDLDNQTTSTFQAYAENDTIDVSETSHTGDLYKKLKSEDGGVIVTTIQKLQRIIKRYPEGTKQYDKLHKLNLIFIVDECHRAVTPKAQAMINEYFTKPLWFGFTGTPIFGEEAKNSEGNLPKTTDEQYGCCLNTYTVKDAIHDEAVLGFQVEYRKTFEMKDLAEKNGITPPKDDADGRKLEKALREAKALTAAYHSEEHMKEVVNFILNHANEKLGLDKKKGESYTAILTTDSIAQAQKYYKLFQSVKRGEDPDVKISEKTKRQLSDFPRIAITYSVSENDDKSSFNQDMMKESMTDYNDMFGTSFTMETIDAYNTNVNARLARKSAKYQVREEELDIVIVVDRLLTGFDAPCLSTLFIDRMPMHTYDIVQAFSRTNRLFDERKTYGQIVIFQAPATWKYAVDLAFKRYSNGGEKFVQAPDWEAAKNTFSDALNQLRQIAKSPEDVDALSKKEKAQFLKAYSKLDKALADLRVYTDFQDVDLAKDYGLSDETIEEFNGKYENVREELKRPSEAEPEDVDLDIDYELQCQHRDQIDEDYILRLMEATREDEGTFFTSLDDPETSKLVKAINEDIDRYEKTNPARAEILKNLWQDYQQRPEEFINRRLIDVMNERIENTIHAVVTQFAQEWCINADELGNFLGNYDTSIDPKDKQLGQDALREASSPKEYKKTHPNIGLKYWRKLLEAIRELYVKKVQGLIEK